MCILEGLGNLQTEELRKHLPFLRQGIMWAHVFMKQRALAHSRPLSPRQLGCPSDEPVHHSAVLGQSQAYCGCFVNQRHECCNCRVYEAPEALGWSVLAPSH